MGVGEKREVEFDSVGPHVLKTTFITRKYSKLKKNTHLVLIEQRIRKS